jgi:hypothetical protein
MAPSVISAENTARRITNRALGPKKYTEPAMAGMREMNTPYITRGTEIFSLM